MYNRQLFNKFIFNRKAGIAFRFHPILEAEYYEETPDVNRSVVVGADLTGGTVTGSAITSAEASQVGERLDIRHDVAVTTATAAGYAAAAVLYKASLDGRQAKVTIPPHCGLELWDVVMVVDIPGNQGISYRVSGYIFEFDTSLGDHLQKLVLRNL